MACDNELQHNRNDPYASDIGQVAWFLFYIERVALSLLVAGVTWKFLRLYVVGAGFLLIISILNLVFHMLDSVSTHSMINLMSRYIVCLIALICFRHSIRNTWMDSLQTEDLIHENF